MTRLRLLPILLLLASCAMARAAVVADQPYRLDTGNRLSTDVTINGKGPYSFLIDTASSISFLFEHVRTDLGLAQPPAEDAFDTYGLVRVFKARPVTLSEVKLSDLTFRNMRMGVMNGRDNGPDGILGIDAFEGHTLVLDRDQMRLRMLTPGDNGPQAWRDWASTELTPHRLRQVETTFWSIRADFGGQRFTALLDLGAGITIINWKAAEQLGIKRSAFSSLGPPDKRLRDVLGDTAPTIDASITITLGNHRFPFQRVLIANAPVFELAGMKDVPAALIGSGLLRDHSLAVDFPGRRLYVGPQAGGVKSAAR